MSCPKCGFPRQPESTECPKCGILYGKYEQFIKSKQTGNDRKVRVEKKREKKETVKIFLKKLSIKKRFSQLSSFQKMIPILFVVLTIIGIGFMIFKPDIIINGEIFIVTKKGQNIKLGLVEVNVFPMDTLLPYLAERKKERNYQLPVIVKKIEAAKTAYDAAFQEAENAFQWDFDNFDKSIATRDELKRKWLNLRAEEQEVTSCNFFFRKLPAPLTSAKTNSEGNFNLLIPGSGLHVITASATRRVVEDVEKYYWITTIDPKKGSRQIVILSNDNRVSANEIEILINMYANKSP